LEILAYLKAKAEKFITEKQFAEEGGSAIDTQAKIK